LIPALGTVMTKETRAGSMHGAKTASRPTASPRKLTEHVRSNPPVQGLQEHSLGRSGAISLHMLLSPTCGTKTTVSTGNAAATASKAATGRRSRRPRAILAANEVNESVIVSVLKSTIINQLARRFFAHWRWDLAHWIRVFAH
jgi:hypothetical protein